MDFSREIIKVAKYLSAENKSDFKQSEIELLFDNIHDDCFSDWVSENIAQTLDNDNKEDKIIEALSAQLNKCKEQFEKIISKYYNLK